MRDLTELTTVDDVTQELIAILAEPADVDDALRARVRALVERAQRIPREIPGRAIREYRHELVKMRDARGMTSDDVAAEMDWSPSKSYRIFAGLVSVSVSDMRALARLLGADEPTVERLVAESRAGYRRGRPRPRVTDPTDRP